MPLHYALMHSTTRLEIVMRKSSSILLALEIYHIHFASVVERLNVIIIVIVDFYTRVTGSDRHF